MRTVLTQLLLLAGALGAALPAGAQPAGPQAARTPPDSSAEALRRAVSALQLAAQEYRLAFTGVVLTAREEADEAALFVTEARRAAAAVAGVDGRELSSRLADVAALIQRGAAPDTVAARAAATVSWMGSALGATLEERPPRAPSLAEGTRLYAARCAQCHGARGYGDGPLGAGLNPPPARFAEPAVLASATPLDVYRRITLGVPGTGMPAFGAALTEQQRWDLALRVVALADSVAARAPEGGQALALATVRARLNVAIARAAAGDAAGAEVQALDAYLAFEPLEPPLRAGHAELAVEAEHAFAAFRAAAAGPAPGAELAARRADLRGVLARTADALAERPSAAGLFTESFLLLLREGLEAILILGAIVAVVVKSGAAGRKREVRWGAGLAVLASLVTAALLRRLLRVAPAQQEALEGAVMLVAAAVLFYVSYWMVSKLVQRAWRRFVTERIEGALAGGSAFALAAAAFLAVYREGFETVLFYQALYGTGGATGTAAITAGLVAGGAALVAVFVAIERFGVRIPLRPFFAVTGGLLYFMAFVFAGRGVAELQEGGWIGSTPLAGFPTSDFLGVHPTVQGLVAQGLVVAALCGALVWMGVVAWRADRHAAARAAESGVRAGPSRRRTRRTVPRRLEHSPLPAWGPARGRGAAPPDGPGTSALHSPETTRHGHSEPAGGGSGATGS